MADSATLTISSGPDRGKVFRLEDELVHVGTGPENQIVVRDPAAREHTASLVRRNGRYAIYTPFEHCVEVDGSPLPVARWVWLPETARIRISDRTALVFSSLAGGPGTNGTGESSLAVPAATTKTGQTAKFVGLPDAEPGGVPPTPPLVGEPSPADSVSGSRVARPRRPGGKRAEKKRGTVARFITDQPGEPLVKLGEDGHLPELALADAGPARTAADRKAKAGNPALAYLAVGCSLLVSLGLLFVEADLPSASSGDKARARQEITEFYGAQRQELRPYQRLLREARLAQARGDKEAEQSAYRRVLELLNSEDNTGFTGLTGSKTEDERLRSLIGVLLAE